MKKVVFAWVFGLCWIALFVSQDIGAIGTAWVARYNGTGNFFDRAYAIAVDDSGNVYVTGESYSALFDSAVDYATIKYNDMGDTVWVRRYYGSVNDVARSNDIDVDNSGNVYVTGWSWNGSSFDYTTIKYSSTGDTLWVSRYSGSALALAIDDSGNVYVTGGSYGAGTSNDYVTIKYNDLGDTVWVRRYNGAANHWDRAHAIALDPSGNVYVTGESRISGSSPDITTISYSSTGDTRWVRSFNGPANYIDIGSDIAVDNSGNVYVTGETWNFGGDKDYVTIKYNRNGGPQWVRLYDGPVNTEDMASSIVVDTSGNVYVTGKSGVGGVNKDYATIKYNSNGDSLWVRRYNGPGDFNDYGNDIAVDDSGNVYVTGASEGIGTYLDYATIKYSSTGESLWTGRYDGPINGYDGANALAVDKFGNIYVTGESSDFGYDYATIKYCRKLDLKTLTLPSPPDTVFTDSTYTPEAWVHNSSICGMTFDAIATIDGYADTQQVTIPEAGDSSLVTFAPWMVPTTMSTTYKMTVCIQTIDPDEDPTNDCVEKFIYAYNPVGIEESPSQPIPTRFSLYQSVPNPGTRSVEIRYAIPEETRVKLQIYDISGRLVETLVDAPQKPGAYQVEWDGARIGSVVRSGIYFYRLTATGFDTMPTGRQESNPYTMTKKMILLR